MATKQSAIATRKAPVGHGRQDRLDNAADVPDDSLDGMKRRLADAERTIARLLKCMTIRRDLRLVQADEEREARDAEQAAEYRAGEPLRRGHFDRFVAERCTLAPIERSAEWAPVIAFQQWARDEGVPPAERLTETELADAVLSLPGVEPTTVRAGALTSNQSGYAGIGVQAQWRHKHDAGVWAPSQPRVTTPEELATFKDLHPRPTQPPERYR